MPRYSSTPERFWTKVDFNGPVPGRRPELGPCWLWDACRGRDDYGVFRLNGKNVRAHRWAYEFCIGPIPEGLELDHLCRTHACVEPDHVEPVTSRENTFRSSIAPAAINARKTHCAKGHQYNEVNTRWYLGSRKCRTCNRLRNARRRTAQFITKKETV